MTASLGNYLTREPRAASLPSDATPVVIRLALVALLITVLALLA